MAMLWSRTSQARHRTIAADLAGWLATRWSWVKPRTVPLLVAFAGMLATLGAAKYLSTFAIGDDLRLRPSAVAPMRARCSLPPDRGTHPAASASGFEAPLDPTFDQPAALP
jgi:hypothetical protein